MFSLRTEQNLESWLLAFFGAGNALARVGREMPRLDVTGWKPIALPWLRRYDKHLDAAK
jgi:hypothetical protein